MSDIQRSRSTSPEVWVTTWAFQPYIPCPITAAKRLPPTISSAITGGRDADAVVGNSTLTVKRTDNESGTDCDMRFRSNNGNPKGCTGLQHAQRAGTAAQTQGRYQDVQAQSVATALGAGDSNISETASVRLSKA